MADLDVSAAPAAQLHEYQRLNTASGTAYVERGSGEVLILIHGVGMRLDAWRPQIEALSSSHRVIAVDMPGHGQSSPLPKGSLLPDFVAWLAGFLDDMQLERVNLAGHSMGALIAGGAAATFPQRLRRVALLNGVYRRDEAAKAAVLARARSIATEGIDVEGPVSRWFGTDEGGEIARRLTRDWLTRMDKDAYETAYAAFAEGDSTYADAWPACPCPALFLTGADDPNSTAAMAETMASLAPHGLARVIAAHRHMVNLTAPEEVNRLLLEWLNLPETEA
ncbi:pimeloyl-ACP methyl ester carboxylesterase [Rhizobium paknamense]|uniref:Pimeloyl-ACP methyl ester carboxylesterase n=2 Tax=Rhizobium paknamense TaxID=1206817 RepID=A0ABU0IHR2_9HYPH|nr:alpha/beta fold hydrolase [Rhizobium paknamense]MDQ0457800.1 pimeloyl-ACP methyl ester carboxylesterase [Rhizobium paknamense]